VRRCRSAVLPFGSLPDDQGVIGHPVPIVLQMAVMFTGLAILSAFGSFCLGDTGAWLFRLALPSRPPRFMSCWRPSVVGPSAGWSRSG